MHWDELRHLAKPDGFTRRQWWLAIKISRRAVYRLPFADSNRITRRLIASSPTLRGKLNQRQLAAVEHLMKHSHVVYRIQEHQTANNVTYETARTDLLELVDLRLLEKHREGKAFVFQIPQKLRQRLAVRAEAG